MAIGMTYEQYWYGDPLMVRAYYQAEQYRQEQRDTDAWLIGAYVAQAISATVCNALLKKGSQPNEYPRMPSLVEKRAKEKEERRKDREREEEEQLFALAWMSNFVQVGKNWGKKKG